MGRERIKLDLLIHDLKVPLAVIDAGITSLLGRVEKYGPLTEKQKKVLVRVLRNTKVTKRLVNDTLELGRSREGIINLTNFKPSELVEKVLVEIFDLNDTDMAEKLRICTELTQLQEILEEKGFSLLIDKKIWCEDIYLDKSKMKQILRNLLTNALKYRKNRVELNIENRDGYLSISVKDDGDGIPLTYHDKIFKSYFQMDYTDSYPVRGHGLGLAGVMVLVEDMEGRLILESDENKGAKFVVMVPLGNK